MGCCEQGDELSGPKSNRDFLTGGETVSLSIRTVICVVNYLFSNSPIILPASAKQSIARQFPMLDSYVTAQVSAEILW